MVMEATATSILGVGEMPKQLGDTPDLMHAWVVRKEREGEPTTAFQREIVPVPELGANDVLVMVKAAGVNYNGVWTALGKPVSVLKMTGEAFHIGGSDASGIVWKVGSEVHRWKIGDEVIVHCNQTCGQCPACNGQDPMACEDQKIWGYETNWGSFAQFTKVQSQQLLAKPKHLTWEEAASYGLVYFTAYRMLVGKGELEAGDNVLVWGGAGGLGAMAIQICKLYSANAIAVVSSEEKARMCMELGAKAVIYRNDFKCWLTDDNETPERRTERMSEMRRFGKELRRLTGGYDPDIVFEHVGKETFPISVFVAKKFGKVLICGATSGYDLDFDVRYLWMRQKTIVGSHFANAYQAERANRLVVEKKIQMTLGQTFSFDDLPLAHQIMRENKHKGKMSVLIQAPVEGLGRSE